MDKEKQIFQIGDTAYMIDEDYRYFESEIYKVEKFGDEIIYTCEWDFTKDDVGVSVFTSELYRQIRMENMIESN